MADDGSWISVVSSKERLSAGPTGGFAFFSVLPRLFVFSSRFARLPDLAATDFLFQTLLRAPTGVPTLRGRDKPVLTVGVGRRELE